MVVSYASIVVVRYLYQAQLASRACMVATQDLVASHACMVVWRRVLAWSLYQTESRASIVVGPNLVCVTCKCGGHYRLSWPRVLAWWLFKILLALRTCIVVSHASIVHIPDLVGITCYHDGYTRLGSLTCLHGICTRHC
ncbi:LOW QUALITY PROTEIN: hypothetical protein TorRG33x02_008110 [Trema orientale]|uniref:Uncharacterized protein n=1 Tax=Trema orientale TaxID=63057 RepID=A0A2P5G0P8_TREOI|nr:LOW QUALITY PROTEIN: hypothetical protein TorRG33x02_008110 [Trema orientale]